MAKSQEQTPIDDYVTYEVTVPLAAEDQTLALQGLANSYGWRVRERPTLPSDLSRADVPERWTIKESQLAEISAETWGDDVYGRAAAAWYGISDNRTRRRRDDLAVFEYPGDYEDAGTYFGHRISTETGLSDNTLVDLANATWLRTNSAHLLEFRKPPANYGDPKGRNTRLLSSIGPVTRDRLANNLRTRGLDHHNFHGAIGKSLDVLGLASGVILPSEVGSADTTDMDFVTREDFEEKLAEAPLSDDRKHGVVQLIEGDARWQLRDNRPHRRGEIVLEGWFGPDPRGRQYRWTYDKIAVSSLRTLAEAYSTKNPSGRAARRFLKSFS